MLIAAAFLAAAAALCYVRYAAPTRVAVFNFPDFTVDKMVRSNDNRHIRIESVPLDEAFRLGRYDVALVRVHGASLDATHMEAVKRAVEKGTAVFSTESGDAQLNSQSGAEQAYLTALMENECVRNYRSLFNYARCRLDGKLTGNGGYGEPAVVPSDYYFYKGEDNFFAAVEDYQDFYESSGKYREGAPRVALLTGNIDMQNSNPEHIEGMIDMLEARGLNVYPIKSFGPKRLRMTAAVRPDLIINNPHGRLVMGAGEAGVDALRELDVPILAPVTVSGLYDQWMSDRQGMTARGMATMSVVMPELDGATVPMAVAAQFERGGRRIFDVIPGQGAEFCSLAERLVRLRTKANAEKRIAIYYYKGAGRNAVSAADLEALPSLFNTLHALEEEGYDLTGLPDGLREFEDMVQRRGAVLGPYALGAFDDFLREGEPYLVDTDTLARWMSDALPAALVADVEARYGEAPGDYLAVEKGSRKYVAVAGMVFGNVAVLPQPLPAVGDDTEKIIHGVEGPPAYPYIASYLWTRYGFGADALVHFGTHGSLEFIPGKALALSGSDWTDALVGGLPHFYVYTIGNVGEGIIAKRRSYAALVDHLTAPLMRSGLYDNLKLLEDRIHGMESMEEGPVKRSRRESITELARKENVLSALGLAPVRTLTDEEIERVHIYLEEISGSKVNDGLYTLGEPYTEEELDNTARLMSLDPLRYALAGIDAAHGRIPAGRLDDLGFMARNYDAEAGRLIARGLKGESASVLFKQSVSPEDRALLERTEAADEARREAAAEGMRSIMAAAVPKSRPLPRFLDDEGRIIEDAAEPVPTVPAAESVMEKMASVRPAAPQEENPDENLVQALRALKEALENIRSNRDALAASTRLERQALVRALSGRYIEPSSAGDPVINPRAVPTGRNFYSIDPEGTPSDEAWKVGRRLAENLLDAELSSKGRYPLKVGFTLWSSDFISTEGATVAQILYLLGVEPMRDGFGRVRSLRLIPSERLGRPRIDVVVQTSGQLRDIAASRLELIRQAVGMAATAQDGDNYVRKGVEDSERMLLAEGYSPADARRLAGRRVFGGANGNYGAGIMGLVEKGDGWEDRGEIAERYLSGMSGMYSGPEEWGESNPDVFRAALLNTNALVQPRASNMWGPLSLDHVYEFMGGMSAAVQQVTGSDPSGYFSDFRNGSRARVQELKEAIGVETGSTVFNPEYISRMMDGGASAMESFAETVRNTFGWNAVKPSAIDGRIWEKYYDIYVEDSYGLGLEKTFTEKNAYALQEITAVMAEAARKGMWEPTDEQLRAVTALHARLVVEKRAACSGFVCDNALLRKYISDRLDPAAAKVYEAGIKAARQIPLEKEASRNATVLKKETGSVQAAEKADSAPGRTALWIMCGALAVLFGWLAVRGRRKR